MYRIILSGCAGKMGGVVTEAVAKRDDCEIVAGIDVADFPSLPYPVFLSFEELSIEADVIIDFSTPAALMPLLKYATEKHIALMLAVTGYTDAQIDAIKKASEITPIFFSANMSLGINLLCELAKTAARVLGDSFDIEITEAHHNNKIDAPSGTALMLANEINSALDGRMTYEYDRHLKREKRSRNEIGIHSLRGGTITGEHTVMFAGNDEIITLSHSARSKSVFAEGAINAAAFLVGKSNGLYSMKDLINE